MPTTASAGKPASQGPSGCTPSEHTAPTISVLHALAIAIVDRLTVDQIRERTGATSWTGCGLQDVLDSLRDRRLVAYVGLHTYALTDAGRAALRGGAAHG